MEIIKKAFRVWHEGMLNENPHEGYRIDDVPVVYAESASKAKSKAPSEVYNFYIDDEEARYTDLKVRRAKGSDVVIFEGQEIPRYRVNSTIRERERVAERTAKVLSFPDDAMFYIQNGVVGNAALWWGLGSSGYVCDINKAQQYTKTEVLSKFVSGREEDRIWEASHVLEGIKEIVDTQFLKYEFQA